MEEDIRLTAQMINSFYPLESVEEELQKRKKDTSEPEIGDLSDCPTAALEEALRRWNDADYVQMREEIWEDVKDGPYHISFDFECIHLMDVPKEDSQFDGDAFQERFKKTMKSTGIRVLGEAKLKGNGRC